MKKMDNKKLAAGALLAMQRHSWEQGVAMQAFLEMGEMDVVVAMAWESVYRSMPDGRTATIGVTDGVTDPCSTGSGIFAAYEKTGDKALKDGYQNLLHWALKDAPRNEKGVVYHLNTSHEFWADSMYMLPPFLAEAGYWEEALTNLYGYWEALYDKEARLMCHMWDDDKQSLKRAAHWGTGSGWTLAALVRLDGMMQGKEELAGDQKNIREMFRELLSGVLSTQRTDGLFYDVVDDASTFVETNLAQMTAYSIYRGMSQGMLPESYAENAHSLREAAKSKMNPYGFLRGVCGAPTFDKPGYSPEGQAFYLLMEQAYEDWSRAAEAIEE